MIYRDPLSKFPCIRKNMARSGKELGIPQIIKGNQWQESFK